MTRHAGAPAVGTELTAEDYTPTAEPSASEGEDLAWTADPGEHLGHDEVPLRHSLTL